MGRNAGICSKRWLASWCPRPTFCDIQDYFQKKHNWETLNCYQLQLQFSKIYLIDIKLNFLSQISQQQASNNQSNWSKLIFKLIDMNQQCKVCGEPAAGFHFGAFTCEGCKVRILNYLSTLKNWYCLVERFSWVVQEKANVTRNNYLADLIQSMHRPCFRPKSNRSIA